MFEKFGSDRCSWQTSMQHKLITKAVNYSMFDNVQLFDQLKESLYLGKNDYAINLR